VFVRFFLKPGAEVRAEAILRTMVAATRAEPGCRRYDLFRSTTAEGAALLALIEQYDDDEAIGAHRETPHYKAYRAEIMALLSQPIEVTRLESLDVGGEAERRLV
jgi:quinol monooxygenase YgiN